MAFSIAIVETSRPFDTSVPLLGVSAVGLWVVVAAAVIPSPPNVRLALALAAATTWPIAYGINTARFGFTTESWRHASIWPVMNYLLAIVAYVVGRLTYGVAREAQSAPSLGSYTLMSQIGEGGMGEVWRASHKLLARPAAIKLVKLDESRQELFAQRFHREANTIAALKSPHTVYLYDFGTTEDGRLYYVMELLDGISLQTLINEFGPQPRIARRRDSQADVPLARGSTPGTDHSPRSEAIERDDLPGGANPRLRESARLRTCETLWRRRSV